MNWSNVALLAQRFVFGMTSTTVAGSVFVLAVLMLERIPTWKDSRLHLVWLKIATFLYLLPITSVLVMVFRIDFFGERLVWTSPFGMVLTWPMRIAYSIVAGIWCVGLLFVQLR